MTIPWVRTSRRVSVVAIAAAGVAVLAPGSAVPAQTDAVASWAAPTPSEGAALGVAAKTQLSVSLAASSLVPNVGVRIRTSGALPAGAVLTHTDGNTARARFTWTPSGSQVGRVPGDVHRLDRRANRCGAADGRDPRRPREQASTRAGAIRRASIRRARCSAPGRPRRTAGPSFGGTRSRAQGRRGAGGLCPRSPIGRLSSTGTHSRCSTASRTPTARRGSGSGCRSCRTGRPAGCSAGRSTSSRRFARG